MVNTKKLTYFFLGEFSRVEQAIRNARFIHHAEINEDPVDGQATHLECLIGLYREISVENKTNPTKFVEPLLKFLDHHKISHCQFYVWCVRNLFIEKRLKTSGIIIGDSDTGKTTLIFELEKIFESRVAKLGSKGSVFQFTDCIGKQLPNL